MCISHAGVLTTTPLWLRLRKLRLRKLQGRCYPKYHLSYAGKSDTNSAIDRLKGQINRSDNR